ncbi:hypothetical protein FIA58_008070 [Flavobacterium jejuense]|uniref:Lipoprotein n=1 Tax=Flavobacterium jejuense TaxID=1544455 RepID=A0ABX0IU62_9FLAO|nr:hypothetical protein [Flavobacterium jejuense]NHN25631.1 hypothetical protein [Flavobacterium jejuense]
MRKGAFIFILSLFFINCLEKTKVVEKTYEELEAEVLSDVLPDVIKDYYKKQPIIPPPPFETNSKTFSKKQLDSINTTNTNNWKILNSQISKARDSFIKLIPKHKKATFGIVDSLWSITLEKIKGTENYFFPLCDSLNTRVIYSSDFLTCSVNIKTIPKDSIFEGEIRNNPNLRVIGLSRVLIDKPKENAYFEVFQYNDLKKVSCYYLEEKNKWIVKEIVEYD